MTCRWCYAEDEWTHTDSCPTVAIEERDALIEALAKVVRVVVRHGEGTIAEIDRAAASLRKLAVFRQRERTAAKRTEED